MKLVQRITKDLCLKKLKLDANVSKAKYEIWYGYFCGKYFSKNVHKLAHR